MEMNLQARAFMVHTSLVTSHRFRRVIVLVLRGIHWGVQHVLLLLTMMATSTALGVGYRLSQKARREDLHRQTLLCWKGLLLRWPRRQLKFQGYRQVNQAETVGASHGSLTVISTLWNFHK